MEYGSFIEAFDFRRAKSGWSLGRRAGGAWGGEWVEPGDESGWSLGTRLHDMHKQRFGSSVDSVTTMYFDLVTWRLL